MSAKMLAALAADASFAQIVQIRHGMAVTHSLAIAREFGRRHDNVLQSLDSLITDGTINRLEFKVVAYQDEKGQSRRAIELTERGALIAMPFIGGRNSRLGQIRLVDAFLAMRQQLSRQGGDWREARKRASVAFQVMAGALHEIRSDAGKTTLPHHYSNEARLVIWVLFGTFDAIDRDHLSEYELTLLETLEARNAIWIARGKSYAERKAALSILLESLRATHPVRVS